MWEVAAADVGCWEGSGIAGECMSGLETWDGKRDSLPDGVREGCVPRARSIFAVRVCTRGSPLPSSTLLKDPRFSCRVGGLFCGVEGLILSGRLKDCCDCLRHDRPCMSDDIRLFGIRSDVSARGDGSSPTILCGRSVSSNNVAGVGIWESCLALAAAALRSGSLAATVSFRGDTDFGSGDI